MSITPAPANPPPRVEAAVWRAVAGTWRPLFGGYAESGLSIEWHDFQVVNDFDWTPSFHPGSLEVCLNFNGAARIQDGALERELPASSVASYTARNDAPRASRIAGSLHRFITLEVSPAFLRRQCAGQINLLKLPLQRFVEQGGACPAFLDIRPLNTALLALRPALLDPPVSAAARDAWYLAKAMEVLAHTAFREDEAGELFCERHQRHNRERVERACYLLERDLVNPPSLEMLAGDVGCSVFHLSRVFAEATGVSIPKFLRTRRIERAAQLLARGQSSVTNAAMSVGYSSLSAFNKAFVEQMGCCPGLYPAVKIAGRKPSK